MIRLTTQALFLAVALALSAAPSDASLLQIRPLGATVEAVAGEPFSFQLQLSNRSLTDEVDVELSLTDIVQTAAAGTSYPAAGSTSYSAAPWLRLPVASVHLASQASRVLEIVGLAPSTAAGSYHAVILIRPLPPTGATTRPRAGMSVEYAFPVDIQVGDAGSPMLVVDALEPMAGSALATPLLPAAAAEPESNRCAVRLEVSNQGDRFDFLRGHLYVTRQDTGEVVQKVAVREPGGVRLLPHSSRAVLQVLPLPLAAGDYRLELRGSFASGARSVWARQPFAIGDEGVAANGEALERWSQDGELAVEPGELQIGVSPRTRAQRRVVIRNPGEERLRCRAELLAFGLEPDGTLLERPLEANSSFVVSPMEFNLGPRSASAVSVSVGLGEGLAEEREHYWLMRVIGYPVTAGPEVPARALGTALVVASDRAAVKPADVQLEAVSLTPQLRWTELTLRLSNGGGQASSLTGYVLIGMKPNGGSEYRLTIGATEPVHLLAGAVRDIPLIVPGVTQAGSWSCELRLNQAAGDMVRLPFEINVGDGDGRDASP